MTETNKISRRLVLTAASVLPLSACVGALEEDYEGSGVRVLGLTSVSNVSMFKLDLIAGAGQDAAANVTVHPPAGRQHFSRSWARM